MNSKQTNQLNRMRQMMTYGTVAESKSQPYKSVEYERVASDGQNYAIIREGVKYYIKVSDKKKPLKEDYDYIGGFRNRQNYEYDSYAKALKQFDMKMMSLREASANKTDVLVESWRNENPNTWDTVSSSKMKEEISRMRQIMSNAAMISEGKSGCVKGECAANQKNNIKKIKQGKGNPLNQGGDPYTENPDSEYSDNEKTNVKKECKPVMSESSEVLGWNDNSNYLDTSNGTEIGSSAPFTKKPKCGDTSKCKNGVCCEDETVNEGTALYDEGDDQNSPQPGTGKIGDSAPFTKKINEDEESDFDDVEDEEIDIEDDDTDNNEYELEIDDEESLDDDELEDDFEDDSLEDEPMMDDSEISTLRNEMDELKDTIQAIADKLGVNEFEDEDLYDDEDKDLDSEDDDEDFEFEIDTESEDEDGDEEESEEVFESRSFKKMVQEGKKRDFVKKTAKKIGRAVKDFFETDPNEAPNPAQATDEDWDEYERKQKARKAKKDLDENRLDYFGKHPAYRKKVMTLPPTKMKDKEGYYDMNDDSVTSEEPFGTSKEGGQPFDIDPKLVANSIAESISRHLRRKNR